MNEADGDFYSAHLASSCQGSTRLDQFSPHSGTFGERLMSMNALSSCMYVSSVHAGTGGDQKKAPDPLGLEFQAAVCHHSRCSEP